MTDTAAAFLAAARPFWHPVARSSDVPPGGTVPVTLLEEQLVLWRAPDGTLSLLDDLCSHRGVRLSMGAVTDDGCLRCPYHAWEYDTTGACTRIPQLPHDRIPARADVAGYQTTEHSGLVWACLVPPGEEARPAPRLEEVDDLGTHWLHVGEPMDWDCQATRQIENFCDVAHVLRPHPPPCGSRLRRHDSSSRSSTPTPSATRPRWSCRPTRSTGPTTAGG